MTEPAPTGIEHVTRIPLQPVLAEDAERPTRRRARVRLLLRVTEGLFAIWLFISAIAIMKDGASALAPILTGSTLTDSLFSALGFGWIGAMVVMSGSPVAASSLTLLNAEVVTREGAFMMLTGSRIGAAFVVLVVAFVYAVKGRTPYGKRASLSIGVFALLMTGFCYIPAIAIGLPLLQGGALDGIAPERPLAIFDFVDLITAPLAQAAAAVAPAGLLFFVGLAALLASIKLFDRALPDTDASTFREHTDWRSRKWIMFGLGSLVALVTMSVSVALTMLVPAVSKGYVRRRQTLPYIMGANVTTLGDTLLTAFIINDPDAVRVVLAELIGVLVITILLLALLYRPLTEGVVRLTDQLLVNRRRMGLFVGAMFVVPLALIYAM